VTAGTATFRSSQLRLADILHVGGVGLHTRRLRAALSALGIAIGIASMVAVLGVSASSQADLLATIDRLGTNLLTVEPGQSFLGQQSELPTTAAARVSDMPGIEQSAAIYQLDGVTVRRNQLVDESDDSGITVYATDRTLPSTLGAEMAFGHFLTPAEQQFPTVVLGKVAAKRLGLSSTDGNPAVYLGGQLFAVVGIFDTVTLDPSIDRAAFVGRPEATADYQLDANASKLYVRADEDELTDVRDRIGPTANAENPEEVAVSRPSDALEAKAAAEGAFTTLLLGLGVVALLVGGVGIANVMVISVLERRSEIGLRRALGATRRHVATQFLTESLLLAAIGGAVGAALGAIATAVWAIAQAQAAVIPPEAIFGGLLASLLIGTVAGLYPATRASRLSPTEALRTV
jgi:putative ABC transport system permease protein